MHLYIKGTTWIGARVYVDVGSGTTWIGARAYVDVVFEINIDKTKIMKFNTPQPRSELRPQYLVYQFNFPPPDHPNKTRQLKVVDSFKYFGIPIDNDLTVSTLVAPIPDKFQKVNGKLQGLLRDLKSNRELHSSHHSTLRRASTSPKTICHLWK
jgi:hypothetical protein